MKEYTVCGTPVRFPFAPYPAQLAMLNQALSALKKGQNCLLESPTGTGKSMALLCAAISWLKKYNNGNANGAEGDPMGPEEPSGPEFEDFDDFEPSAVKRRNSCGASAEPKPKKVPKIFFASRTHSQLSQLVRELRKSEYADVRMTILGSRTHYCIHPVVSKSDDVSGECRRWVNGESTHARCQYYERTKRAEVDPDTARQNLRCCVVKARREQPAGNHLDSGFVWDMEELKSAGHQGSLCPYYLSNGVLYNTAQVVFCPYNYLFDPLIRKSMQISLKGNVVIIDEAHNIEDICRDAVSFDISREELVTLSDALKKFIASELVNLESATLCTAMCEKVVQWMDDQANVATMEVQEPGVYTRLWRDIEMYGMVRAMGLDEDAVHKLRAAVKDLCNEDRPPSGQLKNRTVEFGPAEMRLLVPLEKLLHAAHYLYDDLRRVVSSSASVYSYSLCLKKVAARLSAYQSARTQGGDGFRESIYFWCLNPAVAFTEMTSRTKSVVLASGTLAPMETYAFELGSPFAYTLEAMHVMPPERMCVRCVGSGPHGRPLTATYRTAESFDFQDEMGAALAAICDVVPDGVLCFLPSYRLMDKLITRWTTSRCDHWARMNKKLVLIEPRGSAELTGLMEQFHRAIEHPAGRGVLMLAVYRGKIAEGIDFADRYARAVVTVGIPYPNVKDVQVRLKRQYNDRRRSDANSTAGQPPYTSGSRWLEVQAFRALNQALGRCLRHKNDWGALVLIDSRFDEPYYQKNLSRWIRSNLVNCDTFQSMITGLQTFVHRLCL